MQNMQHELRKSLAVSWMIRYQGRPSPLRPWCIFPLFQIPPIFKNFSESEENFHNFTFSWKISWFSSAEISNDFFFSHRPQILNFLPYFRCFSTFPPVSRKLLFPHLLWQIFLPCFTQIHLLFTYFTCISFPPLLWPWCIYASPNARTGRPCPVSQVDLM